MLKQPLLVIMLINNKLFKRRFYRASICLIFVIKTDRVCVFLFKIRFKVVKNNKKKNEYGSLCQNILLILTPRGRRAQQKSCPVVAARIATPYYIDINIYLGYVGTSIVFRQLVSLLRYNWQDWHIRTY